MLIRKRMRNARGQAIVEGTAMLYLLTALSTGLVLLISGVGTLLYYKLKLTYVAASAARQAVNTRCFLGALRPSPNFDPAKSQLQVSNTVNQMLAGIGLPQAKVTVTLDDAKRLAKVEVAEEALRLLAGGIIPSTIGLTEVAVEPYDNNNPPGGWECQTMYFCAAGSYNQGLANTVTVPCFYNGNPIPNRLPAPFGQPGVKGFANMITTVNNGAPPAPAGQFAPIQDSSGRPFDYGNGFVN